MLAYLQAVESARGAVAAQHRLASGAPHAGADARAICARFRGCSPGRRTATCSPGGTASAAASRRFLDVRKERGLELAAAHVPRSAAVPSDYRRRGAHAPAGRSVDCPRVCGAGARTQSVREAIFAQVDEEYRLTCEMVQTISRRRLHRRALSRRYRRRLARRLQDHQRGQPGAGAPVARRTAARASEEVRTALLLSINCAAGGLGRHRLA